MAYFIYNDIDSRNMGVILRALPPITRPNRRIEKITIPGRNGTLTVDEGAYDAISISLECYLKKGYDPRKITSWLQPSGEITFSDELDKYYHARIVNSIPLTRVFRITREFIIQLELQPLAYSKEIFVKKYDSGVAHTFVIDEANANMYPYIKLEGSGEIELNINGNTMIIRPDEYIELDCELQMAYKDNVSQNEKVYGSFFTLVPGRNTVSVFGNYTNLEIKYRKMYL